MEQISFISINSGFGKLTTQERCSLSLLSRFGPGGCSRLSRFVGCSLWFGFFDASEHVSSDFAMLPRAGIAVIMEQNSRGKAFAETWD